MNKTLRSIFYGAVLFLSWNFAEAQIQGDPEVKTPAAVFPAADKTPTKLSPELKKLADKNGVSTLRRLSAVTPAAGNNALNNYMQFMSNGVVIDVTVRGDIKTARANLVKSGMKITGEYGRVISGILPLASLPQLEGFPSIQYARPAFKPVHPMKSQRTTAKGNKPGGNADMVISQGDTAERSDIARKKFKVNGKGVKVGILSDSYNNLGTASKGVKRGELPGPGNPYHFNRPVEVLEDMDSTGTDEGRAMLEIVHDVAPGSDLAFHTAFLGEANFAQGIQDLANRGCQVEADDVIYYDEPFFQDGIIAQSVDEAKKKGVTYFSSAGNQSIRSYEHEFQATDVEYFGPGWGTAHNFSAPGTTPRYAQPIYVPQGGSFVCSFQWDQSSYTASGVGASSDLDIYLTDIYGNIVAAGATDNLASGDPIEIMGFDNNTPNYTFFITILNYSGPAPAHIKYVNFGSVSFYLTANPIPGILSPALFGHTKAAGAISTAAAFYLETPPYGLDTALVEPYSSVGGTPNYYDVEGNPIPPLVRRKPDITAPDGGNTSFFDPYGDGDILEDADSYPNFFGTSAAAPHAAGVASLMIEAQKLNTLTPDQIRGVLSAKTSDMDNPYTDGFDKGYDFASGYGLVEADRAVGEVKFPRLFIKNLKLEAACSEAPGSIRNWTVSNPNPFDVEVHWFLPGTNQKGVLLAPSGESSFSTVANGKNKTPYLGIINWEDNFGFTRVDAEFSNGSHCGKEAVASTKEKALQAMAEQDLAAPKTVAEIFPNPVTDHIDLYLSLPDNQPVNVEVSSQDGRHLYSNPSVQSNGKVTIPAYNYKPGMYIIQVKQGTFSKTLKVIKP